MPPRVEIQVEVDPQGQGAAALRQLNVELQGLDNQQQAVGRSSRGIFDTAKAILYRDAIRAIIHGVIDLGKASIQAHTDAETAMRRLIGVTEAYGQSLERARAAAIGLSNRNQLTQTNTFGIETEATIFAGQAGRPQDAERAGQAAIDLAQKYGVKVEDIDKTVKQLRDRNRDVTEELFGESPQQIIDAYSAKLYGVVRPLTEQQKQAAIFNKLLERGADLSGEAERRASTSAGQWERKTSSLAGAVQHIQENINAIFGRPKGSQSVLSSFFAPETPSPQELEKARQQAAVAAGERQRDEALRTQGYINEIARHAEQERQRRLFDESKQALQYVEGIRKKLEESFAGQFATQLERDNPFVHLMSELFDQSQKIRVEYGFLGDAVVRHLQRIARQQFENIRLGAEFESQAKRIRLEHEADRLASGRDIRFNLTGNENRQLDVVNAMVAAAVNAPRDRLEALYLTNRKAFVNRGEVEDDQVRLLNDQLRGLNLTSLLAQFKSDAGIQRGLGNLDVFNRPFAQQAMQRVINDAILQATENIPHNLLVNNPRFRYARDARYSALQGRADQYEQDVRDAVGKAAIGFEAQQDARRDIGEAAKLMKQGMRQGAQRDEAIELFNKRIIAITGELDARELTPDLRRARINALRAEATSEAEREVRAGRAINQAYSQRNIMIARLTNIENLLARRDPAALLKVSVDDNRLRVEQLLGPAPKVDTLSKGAKAYQVGSGNPDDADLGGEP
jgi:hypothetical protein